MEKVKVYFTDFRTRAFGDGLPAKLKKLIRAAGVGQIDMDGKFVAIKLHFGELGNISYLRPNYARAVADVVKEQIGYVPYLTRFPGGVSNTVSESYCPGIMTALASDLQAKGYQYYDWNVSSSDASGNHVPVDTIVQSSCAYGSFTNVILLCHDSAAKTTTVEALPQIIEYYQSQGFVCKAIDRSTVVVHHHINN